MDQQVATPAEESSAARYEVLADRFVRIRRARGVIPDILLQDGSSRLSALICWEKRSD